MLNNLKEVYKKDENDSAPIPYTGLLFMTDDFKDYLHNRVKDQFYDNKWTEKLISGVEEIEETG